MQVVRHEAEAVDAAVELLDGMLKNQVQPVPVPVLEEDLVTCFTAKNDVVYSTGVVNAWFTCHG